MSFKAERLRKEGEDGLYVAVRITEGPVKGRLSGGKYRHQLREQQEGTRVQGIGSGAKLPGHFLSMVA